MTPNWIEDAARAFRANDLARAKLLCLEALDLKLDPNEAHLILGSVLVREGDLKVGLDHLELVLEAAPDSVVALKWAGEAYRRLGRPAEALDCADKSLKIFPGSLDAKYLRAVALFALENYPGAEQEFRAILKLSRPANALHYLGLTLVRLNRYPESLPFLNEACKLEPKSIHHLILLGQVYLYLSDLESATDFCRRALDLRPDDPAANLLMAQALSVSSPKEAEIYLTKTLPLMPDSALANDLYGEWLVAAGRIKEAELYFERSLSINPIQATPLFHQAQVHKFESDDPALLNQMILSLDSPTTAPNDKVKLLFAIAKAYLDLQELDASFAYFDRAHALSKQVYAPRHEYDSSLMGQTAKKAREIFTSERIRDWQRFGNPSQRPLLVLGMIRSGTTLMEQLISAHSEVFGAGELRFWIVEGSNLLNSSTDGLREERIGEVANSYLKYLDQIDSSSTRVIDKMPGNFWQLGFICSCFPNARIIDMVRDPVDIALSAWMTYITPPPDYTHRKEDIVEMVKLYRSTRDHWSAVLDPSRYLQVQYEELSRNPETVMRQVLKFCDLEFQEACLSPEKSDRFVSTPSMYRVRGPIDSASVFKRARFRDYLGVFKELI
jgi:tetratricopeptide (TPR) repeat protein